MILMVTIPDFHEGHCLVMMVATDGQQKAVIGKQQNSAAKLVLMARRRIVKELVMSTDYQRKLQQPDPSD